MQNTAKSKVMERHTIPSKTGSLVLLVCEDRFGEPYLVIKRIVRTRTGRVKRNESVPVYSLELPAFYNLLLKLASQLDIRAV